MGTAKPYLKAMVLSDNSSPFVIMMNRNLIKDWDKALNDFLLKKPKTCGDVFKIQNMFRCSTRKTGNRCALKCIAVLRTISSMDMDGEKYLF